jgi:two-component system sensor histidine kinase AtoS
LAQSIDLLEEELKNQNIEYRSEIQDRLPWVRADANQLVKAFHNLSRNAMQAMPNGGLLTIKAYCESLPSSSGTPKRSLGNGKVTIIFQDTGTGIPQDALRHIFNPFFTTKDSGTGLGLPITHKVITEHGGQIEARSRLGQGTQFTIQLPIHDTRHTEAEPSAAGDENPDQM